MMYKMNNQNKVKYEVMSRIQTVRGVRAFATSPMASVFVLGALMMCSTAIVSISDIVSNIMAHADWGERFSYTFSSLLHTRILVQAFVLLIFAACFATFIHAFDAIIALLPWKIRIFGSRQKSIAGDGIL